MSCNIGASTGRYCGGDHLTFQIYTEEGAHAVVTTPGAGKWYRTNGKPAAQHIYLNA